MRAQQRKPEVSAALTEGQQEWLKAIGIAPAPPAKPSTAPVSTFEKGVAALAQGKAHTGRAL